MEPHSASFNRDTDYNYEYNEAYSPEREKFPKNDQINRIEAIINSKRSSKPFSSYKINSDKNTRILIKILKTIIGMLDKFIIFSQNNQCRFRNMINEADLWGMDSKYIITPTKDEAKVIAQNLLKKFDNDNTAYLIIYPSRVGSTVHSALFLGDANKGNIKENYISWTTRGNVISSDCHKSEIEEDTSYYGTPEIIPIKQVNIPVMKQRWAEISKKYKKYSLLKRNCSIISRNIIDYGMYQKTDIKKAPYLYSPMQLRKHGLDLMMKKNHLNESKPSISLPLNMRKIFENPVNNCDILQH